MYTIIGGDGKEYGPVSVEQVRAWLTAGRANLETRAKLLGTGEWKPLGDFPAFGGEPEEPPLVASESAASAADIPATDHSAPTAPVGPPEKLDISSCFERSWELLKRHFWPLVGANLTMTLITFGLSKIAYIGLAGTLLLGGVFNGGLYFYFLQTLRGKPVTFAAAFAGFGRAFPSLVVASLLVTLFTVLGLIALILPGVYLGVAYIFTYLLILDRGLGFWEAMEVSRRVITGNWWRMLGLLLLAVLFFLLGFALLLVGILVTMPLAIGALVYAYEDLCRDVPGRQD